MSENNTGLLRCRSCRTLVSAGDLFCRACGAVLTSPFRHEPEARKNVVILFIDLVGSTMIAEQLDPEVLRGILDRYYEVCAENVAAHGGVIEKYIGDAVMAVFGVPSSHEDDAARAIRAADAALRAVSRLALDACELGVCRHAGTNSQCMQRDDGTRCVR